MVIRGFILFILVQTCVLYAYTENLPVTKPNFKNNIDLIVMVQPFEHTYYRCNIWLKGNVSMCTPLEVWPHAFLTSKLEVSGQLHTTTALTH